MSKALLINLLLAGAPAETVPAATLACEPPPERALAQTVCASPRLVARDRDVAAGIRVLIDSELPDATLTMMAVEADRLRARRDACMRRGDGPEQRESCLIYAYDRWLERLEEWRAQAQAARTPTLTDPVPLPDLAVRGNGG